MDFTDYDDAALDQLRVDVLTEIERRLTVASAEQRANEIASNYLDAVGREHGQAWVQPTGAHDAYPAGWTVTRDGKKWISLIDGNVWEPGVSGWREETAEGGTPPEWVAPTGAHDAYNTGDRVTFDGAVYESTMDANVYPPTDYPAGWEKVA